MRVYLDACCLSRLTDNQEQPRIRQEAEAIERILKGVRDGAVHWVASDALSEEIGANPDAERRLEHSALLAHASETATATEDIAKRAAELHVAGYGAFDASHLAFAEAAQVDVLLTTDDRFVRRAARELGRPGVAVRNPLSWSQEHLL